MALTPGAAEPVGAGCAVVDGLLGPAVVDVLAEPPEDEQPEATIAIPINDPPRWRSRNSPPLLVGGHEVWRASFEDNQLGFEERKEALYASLPADAGLLVATE